MNNTFFRRVASLLLTALLSFSLVLPAAADDPPDLSSITVSLGSSSEMILNEASLTMSATVSGAPENADLIYSYVWSSSNTSAATVSGTGDTVSIVRGSTPGRATISVTVTATSASDPTVTRSDITATRGVLLPGVTLSSSSFSLKTRETTQLTATLYVPTGSDETVTWSSGNEYVAEVSSGGLVTACSAGTTFISATAGTYSAECAVTVNEVLAATITGTASADDPLSFSYIAGDISTQCSRVLNSSLSYATSLSVPTSAGTLYYGYTSEGEPGAGVGTNENYYYSDSNGSRLLTDVSFVPKPDFSGTANISYTAYGSSGQSFQGTIAVSVSATTGITYSTVGRNRVDFNESDFSNVCQSRTGHELQYVSFSLPSSSRGTLFYKYTGSDLDNKVTSGTAYYLSKIPLLSDVTFVAADGYSGTVTISYTGRDTNGNSFSGSVSIVVSSSVGGKGNVLQQLWQQGLGFHQLLPLLLSLFGQRILCPRLWLDRHGGHRFHRIRNRQPAFYRHRHH